MAKATGEAERPVDAIIFTIHGASFSTALLESNHEELVTSISWVLKHWFWERDFRVHVEGVDWKSPLSRFQFPSLSRVSPQRSKDIGPDDLPPSWKAALGSSPSGSDGRQTSSGSDGEDDTVVDAADAPADASYFSRLTHHEFRFLYRKHGFRVYVTHTLADIVGYMSPRWGNYMTNEVCRILNKRVAELRKDPSGRFENSKIVLLGHSLGSLILYELLSTATTRPTVLEGDQREIVRDVKLPPVESRGAERLQFEVSHFFSVGSPLGAFLVLKNDNSLAEGRNPFAQAHPNLRFYNILHRSDPLAMRLEPLIYASAPKVPEPVYLPSHKTNCDNDSTWRMLMTNEGDKLKAVAVSVVTRFFPSSAGPSNDVANWEECGRKKRYTLPDAKRKSERYGNFGSIMSRGPTEYYEAEEGTLDSRGSLSGPDAGGLVWGSYSSPGTESTGLSNSVRNSGSISWQSAARSTSTCWQSAESSAGEQVEIRPSEMSPISASVSASAGLDGPPWTVRQLVLSVGASLRRRLGRWIDRVVKEAGKAGLRGDAYSIVDSSLDDFYRTVLDSPALPREVDLPTIDYTHPNLTRKKWTLKASQRDRVRTLGACREEIRRELDGEVSETECDEGKELPKRVDFAVTESLQAYLLGPLGLLPSHINYWKCKDTIFFIMKEITGFRPRVCLEKRDSILAEAEKTKLRLQRKLQRLLVKA